MVNFFQFFAQLQEILKSGFDYKSGKVVYNHFKSAMAYEIRERPIFSPAAVDGKG